MTLIALIIVGTCLYALGHSLVRAFGWPMDLKSAGRWGLALLGIAVLLNGAPELLAYVTRNVGPLPTVNIADQIVPLLLVGLGILGYVAWTRGAEERGRGKETPRLPPRRRAAPPPPTALADADADDGFAPVGEHDAEDGEA